MIINGAIKNEVLFFKKERLIFLSFQLTLRLHSNEIPLSGKRNLE
jgi:hypothetical protein